MREGGLQLTYWQLDVSDFEKRQIDKHKIVFFVCALLWLVGCSDKSTSGDSARDAALQIRDARVMMSAEDAQMDRPQDGQVRPSDVIDMGTMDVRVDASRRDEPDASSPVERLDAGLPDAAVDAMLGLPDAMIDMTTGPIDAAVDAAVIDAGADVPDASMIDLGAPDAEADDMAFAPLDAGVDAMNLPVCPAGTRRVGEYAEWCGKVNVHRAVGGPWAVDADCRSGCGQARLPYCQKFWPETNQVVEIMVSEENKPFATAACREEHLRRGSVQFACCTQAD